VHHTFEADAFSSYKRRRMGFTTIRTTLKDDKHQFDYSYQT
jgi:hypothetical protein